MAKFKSAKSGTSAPAKRSGERKPGFPGLLYKIIVICFFIVRDQFLC